MIKVMIRIILMPILMVFRLLLGTLAFFTTISSAVIGFNLCRFCNDRILHWILEKRNRADGTGASGQSYRTSCYRELSSQAN